MGKIVFRFLVGSFLQRFGPGEDRMFAPGRIVEGGAEKFFCQGE
jgi:hypothetical protein